MVRGEPEGEIRQKIDSLRNVIEQETVLFFKIFIYFYYGDIG